ncbi:aminoglycoside phosphotransferase family protein [Opitutales bacterium]|nr:aminoglycoside phosphotransferase family protein [Opitutales bacterium]
MNVNFLQNSSLQGLFKFAKQIGLDNFCDKSLVENISYFSVDGKCINLVSNGNGNVNDTFVATLENRGSLGKYTLQRINHLVFTNPPQLMENFSRVSRHLQAKPGRRCLRVIPAKDGQFFHLDEDGNYWRLMEYIEQVKCLEVPQNRKQAYEAAFTFGQFQADLLDLPGARLIETIPDFHNTKKRFETFSESLRENSHNRAKEAIEWIDFVRKREPLCEILKVEELPVRVVHNDTKLNNVLLDADSDKGVCAIDLDTVMPGCVLHDFGDLVRTAACPVSEDEMDLTKVTFLTDTYKAILDGYYQSTHQFLEDNEIAGLAKAPLVITFELGVRFLTDYLTGDTYFKVNYPEHNLNRAKVQFQLLRSMEEHQRLMEETVASVCQPRGRLLTT